MVTDPRPVFYPKPAYPNLARRRQFQGKVVVEALVDVHGHVARVGLAQSSGYTSLDRAAKQGVLKWRFEPAMRDGVAVEKLVQVPVVFRLD